MNSQTDSLEAELLKALGVESPESYVDTKAKFLLEDLLPLIAEREYMARIDELMWALSRLNTFGKETDSDALNRAVDELDDNIGLLRSELRSQERESE